MAKFVLRDASIVVNSVDLSDHCVSVEIAMKADDVAITAMGATGVNRLPGLRDESFKVKWRGDFATSKIDQTLAPLYTGGTSHTVVVKPTSAGVGPTNPTYTGTCYLLEFSPVSGSVGDVADVETTFTVDGVITRATA